jgi:hypothetical protein
MISQSELKKKLVILANLADNIDYLNKVSLQESYYIFV